MVLGRMRIMIEQSDNLSHFERQSLHLLYAPLMSYESIRLYQLLIVLSQLNSVYDYSTLGEYLNEPLDKVEETRKELERFWLLQTFDHDNTHYFRIKMPLDYYGFTQHKILGRLFINEIGMDRLNEIVSILSGYRFEKLTNDISDVFTSDVMRNYSEDKEKQYQQVSKSDYTKLFDMSSFLNVCGETIFPSHLRTSDNLSLIETYALAYKVPNKELRHYVGQSIPVNQQSFNKEKFKELVQKGHVELPKGDPMTWPSEQFLQHLQQGIPAAHSDLILIKKIREKYSFNDEVINVLLDYVIKQYQGSLNPNLVDKIAATWSRAKVKTKEDALKLLNAPLKQKSQRQMKKVIKKATHQKPQEVELDPQERQQLISKLKKGVKSDGKSNEES